MDVYITGVKIQDSPIFFKAYDSSLIQVSDVKSGIVGQPCQFRVDASQAGEGQLEISINDGEVPNHVQVLGGGRCLVHLAELVWVETVYHSLKSRAGGNSTDAVSLFLFPTS